MYKHIIFDFGGVILNFGSDAGEGTKTTSIPQDLAKIFEVPLEECEVFWQKEKTNLIKGVETPAEFIGKLNLTFEKNLLVDEVLALWTEKYMLKRNRINWDVVALIKRLKSKYQIHLLSDAIDLDRGQDPWIQELDSLFDGLYFSHQQHTKKPEAEAYLNILGKIPAQPEECVFIDDVPANVEAAKKLGIKSILFTDYPKLEKALTNILEREV